jgi:hypothetical protein
VINFSTAAWRASSSLMCEYLHIQHGERGQQGAAQVNKSGTDPILLSSPHFSCART